MKTHIRSIIILVFVMKLAYIGFGYLHSNETPFPGITEKYIPVENLKDILDIFKRNDSYWYEKIASEGHEKTTPDKLGKCEEGEIEQSYYQFFPLYPAIIGATMQIFGSSFSGTAFIYSLIFSIACFLVFYKFAKAYTGNEEIAFWSTVLLIVFPFHYYFAVYYTESLYLALLLGCFIAINNNRYWLIALFSGLLVLVRPNGAFMLIPLVIYFFEKNYSLELNKLFKRSFREYLPLLSFLSAPIVLIAYCFYLQHMTGDFLAFKTARIGWCGYTTFPWKPILDADGWRDYFRIAYLLLFIIIGLIYIKKLPLSMHALIWINLILPLLHNAMTLPRFISCIFIFSIIFGTLISKYSLANKVVISIILALLQLWTFHFWIIGDTFSF